MITHKSSTTKATAKTRKAIVSATFLFRTSSNGEIRFTVEEGRWLRDTLDCLLATSEIADDPLSLCFTSSVEAFHNRAITSGEFHENAERLLREYVPASVHVWGDDTRLM